MKIRFTKTLQRSLLSAFVLATIVVAPQLRTNAQATPSRSSISAVPPSQTQPVPNTAVVVEFVGMTVSDMDRAVDFCSRVLSFKKVSDVEVLVMTST